MHVTTIEIDQPLVDGGRQNRTFDSDQSVDVMPVISSSQDICEQISTFDRARANAGLQFATRMGILAKFMVGDTGDIIPTLVRGEVPCVG